MYWPRQKRRSPGEERYLVTVIFKHFPQYKFKLTRFAKAKTIALDDWKVLMSQHRRWINSTILNLFELLFIDKLCGFFCFSMRFVVLVDLALTLISPVTVAYIVYLIYLVVHDNEPIPTFALSMLGVIYGWRVAVDVPHRKFEDIGWTPVSVSPYPILLTLRSTPAAVFCFLAILRARPESTLRVRVCE
ncbi:hypothetical protein JCM10207_008002 [Rhodosporidiobolus poonsookiae]